VGHNIFEVVEQKLSVIVLHGDGVISSAMNEHVSRVIQINVIFLHIGEIEEEGSVYKCWQPTCECGIAPAKWCWPLLPSANVTHKSRDHLRLQPLGYLLRPLAATGIP
jgi:hypothetical protein